MAVIARHGGPDPESRHDPRMSDDRTSTWLDSHRPQQAADTPPVDHPLWTLTKRDHRVNAVVRATPGGPEVRILLDGELWWSQVVRPATEDTLTALADAKHAELSAKGWASV